MPPVWFKLRKSLQCRSKPSDVYDPKPKSNGNGKQLTIEASRSGRPRTSSNLDDLIHGSKRHLMENQPNGSPRSSRSDSTCKLKDTIRSGRPIVPHKSPNGSTSISVIKAPNSLSRMGDSPVQDTPTSPKAVFGTDSSSSFICHECGQEFAKREAVEAHHLSKHAVTELVEKDLSTKIVEKICQNNWSKSDNNYGNIDKILKVHNMQKTLAQFEEYREMVKMKASKLLKKHTRCLANGNELLRFYGASVECSFGSNGSYALCSSHKCCLCGILRHGFSMGKEALNGVMGVFTSSTCAVALETIKQFDDDSPSMRKVLIVCRVIAGRVHKHMEKFQELADQTGFDSVAGKVDLSSDIEELYSLNPRALLPCFVVICIP
ncbi:uncharacterized protein LOC132296300 [Cornus florida]|uniref:uncharacterized protein LOC132296300 n=1 Tax=Cornus florida TaxID=4283 RepID=UPI0028A138E7|nr:uncharacterized protein LOC132296300 [Cornus florida]